MSVESFESFFIDSLDNDELPEYSPIGILLFFLTVALFLFLAWYHNRIHHNGAVAADAQGRRNNTNYNNNNNGQQHYFDPSTSMGDSQTTRKPGYKINVKCTICFENAEWPVQTNCGHIYCGSCFITYYDYGSFLKGATCPLCRTNVNILIPQWPPHGSFEYSSSDTNNNNNNNNNKSNTEKFNINNDSDVDNDNDDDDDYKKNIIRNIRWYNRRFSGIKISLWEQIRDLPVMLRNMIRHTLNNHNVALFYRVRVAFLLIFVLLYVIIPKDLVPESVFGVAGFIDDIFIILLVVLQLAVHFRGVING